MKKLFFLLIISPFFASAQLIQPGLMMTVHQDEEGKTREIQVTYRDPERCTDESFIELVTDSGHVSLKPIKHRMSCQIVSWGYIVSREDFNRLKSRPLLTVRIENPYSDNVYYYQVKDQDYLRRALRNF
jgi:hypothetical protein